MTKYFKIYFVVFCLLFSHFLYGQTQIGSIPHLKLWLRADSLVTETGGAVSDWADISTSNYHFPQSNFILQPTLMPNSILNGKPTVYFNGANQLLSTINFSFNDCSIFCVASQNTGDNSYGRLIDQNAGTGFWIGRSANNNKFGGGFLEENDPYGNFETVPNDTPLIFSMIRLNNVTWCYLNQNSFSTPTRTTVFGATNNTSLSIGSALAGGANGKKNLYELIIFDTVISSSNKILIEQYLNDKYAPPISLPHDITTTDLCDTALIPINTTNNHYYNYLWSTGETTPTITVNAPGKYWVSAKNIFGIISTDTINVIYPGNYISDFIFCQGNSVVWNTNLPKNIYTFMWNDLSSDSILTINSPGQYYVKITDNFSCSIVSDTITATVDNFKNIASLGPDTSLCSGNAIYLKQGLQSNLTYTWNTGSNNDSLYISSSGQYSAIITNSNNCVAKDTINVTVVGQAPTAAFLNSVACKNNVVTFTDNSSPPVGNTITSWFWNYGDGTTLADTSHLQNPFYTYADTGNYTVNLIINTDVGCKQTLVKNVHVAPKPTVNFTNAIACKNDSALFSNSSSSINYTPLTYSWNFGDPVSGITNNSSTLTNPKHLFSQQTTYPVKLITTNNAGCKDSLTKNISVKAQVTASFTNNSPCTNAPIIFQDNSIAPAPNNQNIRIWTIGSSTLTGLNATKSFTNPGVYPVTLTVNGSNGCVSSITKQIDVKLPPFADLSLSTICLNDTSKPTNLSVPQSGPITSWNWQSNNSTFSTSQTTSLVPVNSGNYNIKLVVTSSDNCKDSMTKQLTVLPLPNVDFVTNPSTFYYINSPITFSPTINTGSLYKWIIDGNLYSTPVTSVSFNSNGTHSASLYMKDALGCANTKTKVLTVSGYLLDLAIIDVRSHKGADNFISVEADLANFGTVPISNFEISYQVPDAGFIKETWTGNLNPSAFMTYSFNSKSFQKNNTTNFITCVNISLVNSIPDDISANNNLCIAANINDVSVNDPSPNPTDGDINLSVMMPRTSDIVIELTDALGQIVYPENIIHGNAGLNLISIPTTGFNRGSYVLKITIGDKIFIKKVLKVKQ